MADERGQAALDALSTLAGFLVGTIVGLTGVGGGSLMSPLLILLFGVAPTTAVGTDLWFAAITKIVGGTMHHRQNNADWAIVRRLCWGSLPAVAITLWWLSSHGHKAESNGLIVHVLGATLVLSAVLTPFRATLARRFARAEGARTEAMLRWQPWLTAAAGALLGTLITLTSVGAGALGATLLLMLYPFRLNAKRLVGTDILHAVPVALIGGIGHAVIGNINLPLLGSLLLGSVPGVILGARLTDRLPERVVTPALAVVLLIVGVRLLM
ncbi:sulfite exporter TauE/SafE family protein [uncultured Sphingomonas sp.]|uniref:sulfite exporter TauE/SafE family protein n=1 Tax=uncultured Sphingomonas sp. TaxID=158754 RepID=UPI0030F714C4